MFWVFFLFFVHGRLFGMFFVLEEAFMEIIGSDNRLTHVPLFIQMPLFYLDYILRLYSKSIVLCI